MKFIFFLAIAMLSCTTPYGEQEEGRAFIPSEHHHQQEVSLEQMFGRWVLVSINSIPVLKRDKLKHKRNVGITIRPFCYDFGRV